MIGEGGEPGRRRPLLSTEQLLGFGLSDVHTFPAWMSSYRNGYSKENSGSKLTGTSQSPSFCICSVGSVRLDGLLPKGCLSDHVGLQGCRSALPTSQRQSQDQMCFLYTVCLALFRDAVGLCGLPSLVGLSCPRRGVCWRDKGAEALLEAPFPCRALWERPHCFPGPGSCFCMSLAWPLSSDAEPLLLIFSRPSRRPHDVGV